MHNNPPYNLKKREIVLKFTTCQVCKRLITRCTVTCQSKENELIKRICSFVSLVVSCRNVTDLLLDHDWCSDGILRCRDSNQMYGWCLSLVQTASWHRS